MFVTTKYKMEDEATLNPVPENINQAGGVLRYLRDAPPAFYSVKIESFSRLVSLGLERYESAKFDAFGHTWRLVLYPNGNTKRGCDGHISLYLAIDNTDSLPPGWEAHVTYKMFVFDHKDQYLTIQDDSVHCICHFHSAKKESGFDRLISLETFNAATNGYLIDDSCVFGVEVCDLDKNTGNGETVQIIEHPTEVTFDWKICDFSTICKVKIHHQKLESEEFIAGGSKWFLRVYPNGESKNKDFLEMYLVLLKVPTSVKKVLAEYSLVLKNQKSKCRHLIDGERWFSCSDVAKSWGSARFKLLSELKSESSGFILNDSLLLQAKVKVKAQVTSFS